MFETSLGNIGRPSQKRKKKGTEREQRIVRVDLEWRGWKSREGRRQMGL